MTLQADELLDKIRVHLGERPNIREQKMFGGSAFMLNGNMLCGVTKQGQFMVRVGKELEAEARELPGAKDMDFTGKKMGGMLFVEYDALEEEGAILQWIALCEKFVGTLPPK